MTGLPIITKKEFVCYPKQRELIDLSERLYLKIAYIISEFTLRNKQIPSTIRLGDLELCCLKLCPSYSPAHTGVLINRGQLEVKGIVYPVERSLAITELHVY